VGDQTTKKGWELNRKRVGTKRKRSRNWTKKDWGEIGEKNISTVTGTVGSRKNRKN